MEIKIDSITFTDLVQIKSILEERLKKSEDFMNAERGHNYEEYCRRELLYKNDENHEKLKKVNQRIDEFISIF